MKKISCNLLLEEDIKCESNKGIENVRHVRLKDVSNIHYMAKHSSQIKTSTDDISRDELIKDNQALKELVAQLESEKDNIELLNFPWIGNLGQWYWLVETNEVHFNDKKVTNLGYDIDKLPKKINYEFFTSKLHPDDYDRVMKNMMNHLLNKSQAYEVEYRIKNVDGEYVWYYDRGKVTKRDSEGKPLIVAGIVFDITKNKKLEASLKKSNIKLKRLAEKDTLTNLYNRRYLLKKIGEEIQRYNRKKSAFSIIMLDIDHFKNVNDTYGHDVGDEVLKKLSSCVSDRLRVTDVFARWGGEEFMIFSINITFDETYVLAEMIRKLISETDFGLNENITVSLGITKFYDNDSLKSFLKRVDDNLYEAKSNGRNCTVGK